MSLKLITTAARGRGLAVMQKIQKGMPVFAEAPLVAHEPFLSQESSATTEGGPNPLPSRRRRRPPRRFAAKQATLGKRLGKCRHCFRDDCMDGQCLPATELSERYLEALRSPEFVALEERWDASGSRFPVMAAKAALRCVYCDGEVAAGGGGGGGDDAAPPPQQSTRSVIATLMAPSLGGGSDKVARGEAHVHLPREWRAAYEAAMSLTLRPLLLFRGDGVLTSAQLEVARGESSWSCSAPKRGDLVPALERKGGGEGENSRSLFALCPSTSLLTNSLDPTCAHRNRGHDPRLVCFHAWPASPEWDAHNTHHCAGQERAQEPDTGRYIGSIRAV